MALRLILTKNLFTKIARNHYHQQNSILNRKISTTSSKWKRVAFHLSDIGEGIREVIVKEWFVKEGDVVEQFDNLCEVQSDKASVTITSRYDGKILKIHHNIDDIALVGKPLIDFDVISDDTTTTPTENVSNESINNAVADQSSNAKKIELNDNTHTGNKFLTTPAVRRIAYENKVDLMNVNASGPHGRILKSDILEYLNIIPPSNQNKQFKAKTETVRATENVPSISSEKVEKLTGVRKAMFKTMTASTKIPHFSYSDEVNVTNLIKLRESLKGEAEFLGVKLTFMPFFIKAASFALAKYPILNSSLDEENESVIYKSAHNISIAMATPNGLVVPNLKNCEQKTVFQIARELNELLERARKAKLHPNDFANGTFSLSNIGVIGGTYTKPTIASPQVSIGAIGTIHVVPRFIDDSSDKIQRVHLIYVSWSADHRVIDGVTMAAFSNEWKSYVENPCRFILQ